MRQRAAGLPAWPVVTAAAAVLALGLGPSVVVDVVHLIRRGCAHIARVVDDNLAEIGDDA